MTKEELKPIDTSKYKITETGQVLKMTKEELKPIDTSKYKITETGQVLKMTKFVLSAVMRSTENFKHCAEIEEPKIRRMTKKELSRWLREKPTREYKYITGSYIYASFDYRKNTQDEELHESVRIRENDGEWREPLVEIE